VHRIVGQIDQHQRRSLRMGPIQGQLADDYVFAVGG
jgi:hypothetical protein